MTGGPWGGDEKRVQGVDPRLEMGTKSRPMSLTKFYPWTRVNTVCRTLLVGVLNTTLIDPCRRKRTFTGSVVYKRPSTTVSRTEVLFSQTDPF